ncbi:phage baseplate assembly protein V [Granulicella tundricola]|uniref:Gp5/Type VI secretion system Vgr protein OB-fold domain-containing protein n=1 Tax=Granulicella tundricola (strain ATCC BAA-1859 / DSM 23138 / MP5ACTX9) TaxID=1198114 RepID=E8X5E0_GRATM|nr:phage baseplate assembly protein V [Granulicella tundricola]ADW69487.1 hypothetical protein AciX9_2452 [Granulicella tundricola MP5ACTX9]
MTMTGTEGRFFGKFRGTVVNNVDPLFMGRLLVECPDVLSLAPSSWALPCTPLAGPTGTGAGAYLVPAIGTGVWVEFEKGDPEYPIWAGCRWGSSSDVPPLALVGLPVSPSIVFQTIGQNTLMMSDVPGPLGGILLKGTTGALISITELGITISNGQGASISMIGPTVTVNAGALVVT